MVKSDSIRHMEQFMVQTDSINRRLVARDIRQTDI